MDFQPNNPFVRGVENTVVTTTGAQGFHCYHYYASLGRDPLQKPKLYVTPWRYYSRREAQRALALPGRVPDRVLEIQLGAGALLQGPAWSEPLSPAQVRADWDVQRYGNGIELLVLGPLNAIS